MSIIKQKQKNEQENVLKILKYSIHSRMTGIILCRLLIVQLASMPDDRLTDNANVSQLQKVAFNSCFLST